MLAMRAVLAALLVGATCAVCLADDDEKKASPERSESSGDKDEKKPTLAEKTERFERREGLFTHFIDRDAGKVWLLVPPAPEGTDEVARFLYVEGLATGLGSNPIGLDRGQLGAARLLVLRRVGAKVLIEQPNLRYRARSEAPDEVRATRQSFATSVLWAGEVAARDPDGTVLVDLTSFVVRDAHGVVRTLKQTDQGEFELDEKRSAIDFGGCLSFPDNVELQAVLTFSGKEPGEHVRDTLPDPHAVTLVQHCSLVRLPDAGYRPRREDPRFGAFGIEFLDYAAPLDAEIETRWAVRHRLERDEGGELLEPIVYHVDRGAPEPVRTALIEGASWWAKAFAEAGWEGAFRVELLPEGAHPLDVRYNVIQWVHRSTRGWSYGGGVIDPRTGEMIKGHVSLGSLRVRQDRLLFEGLAGTEKTGSGGADDPVQLALARIRQLSAHEVGHTLGLRHNFAASTYGDRASVMDYPAPRVGVTADGELDFTEAYGVGVGAWDLQAIRYLYGELPEGAAGEAERARWLADARARGLRYLSDADARPSGACHPLANLWDNGTDPVVELRHVMRVRRIALERFGERNVRVGAPLARLQEVLAPVYFHHRYQLEAAIKAIGGLDYRHALRGDAEPLARMVSDEAQRDALAAVLEALDPAALDLPEGVLALLLPRPPGLDRNREMFETGTAPAFDALGAAASAADLVVSGLLQRERAARLVDFRRRDRRQPGLALVLDELIARTFPASSPVEPRHAAIARAVQSVVVARLIERAADADAAPAVRALCEQALRERAKVLRGVASGERLEDAHRALLAAEIDRHLARPAREAAPRPAAPDAPPGSPIGAPPFGLHGCAR